MPRYTFAGCFCHACKPRIFFVCRFEEEEREKGKRKIYWKERKQGKIYDGGGKIYTSWENKFYVWKLITNGRDGLWTFGTFENFKLLNILGHLWNLEEFLQDTWYY